MKKKVSFKSLGLNLAGDLYLPDDFKSGKKSAAIVVVHPFGGVKEQTSGLYAQRLAEKGFITLAFDASYQGESEGEPRFLENPYIRTEDIKSAVSFLSSFDEVDANRIGALGICAAGGYVPFTAQTDRRIKAVATISGADMGQLFREGLGGGSTEESLKKLLEQVANDRISVAQGEQPHLENIVPETVDEINSDTPTMYREGHEYYRTSRGHHPNSKNKYVFYSIDSIASYSSYDRVDLISPHPLLMIAGTEADTLYFSQEAIDKAKEPKELFLIEGASHIDLYDKEQYVSPIVEKLNSFFSGYL